MLLLLDLQRLILCNCVLDIHILKQIGDVFIEFLIFFMVLTISYISDEGVYNYRMC